jgi:hypothetical protein
MNRCKERGIPVPFLIDIPRIAMYNKHRESRYKLPGEVDYEKEAEH